MNFNRHLKDTARLAVPMIIARAGLLIMVAGGTAMMGHYGTKGLAYYAAANAFQVVMVLVGVGLSQGIMILVAQARGANKLQECGRYWRVSLVYSAFLGICMTGICFSGELLLLNIGQTAELAAEAGEVLKMISWGLPALAMWIATSFFLEGLGRPLPSMLLTLSAVILNAALNYIFIFGNLNVQEMGAEGAALATSLTRWFMFIVISLYVLNLRDRNELRILGKLDKFWFTIKKLVKIGVPMGTARGLETAAFSTLTLFAGLLGTAELAGYQIAFNLVALIFMCAIGVAGAATIRVGHSVGQQSPDDIRYAGLAAFFLICLIMLCFSVIFVFFSTTLANLYTDDLTVITIAIPLITIASLLLIFDGGQAVLMGALRGMADIWIPPIIQLFAWWGIAVPIAYVLSFIMEIGTVGLMWGILAGALVSSASLSFRFYFVTKQSIKPY